MRKENKMKKITAVLLICTMMLFLAACSSSGDKGSSKETEGQGNASNESEAAQAPAQGEDNKLVFGYITQSLEFDWCKASADAFQYAAEQTGVEVKIADPQGDLEKSLSQFEDFINQGVDGISIYTLTPELDKQMADMAAEAGIPIVFENGLPSEDTDYAACVACQYEDIGYAAMKYISEKWPGAKILYVQGAPGQGVLESYIEGVEKALSEFNNIEIVAEQTTDWGAEEALNVTQNVLQSGVEFDVVFANNEQMATGVQTALVEAGIQDKVNIVATGGSPEGLEAIKNGELAVTMSAPVCIQGVTTFKNLYTLVNGGNPDKFTPLPVVPIDADNLDDAILWTSYDKALEYIGGIEAQN